MTKLAESPTPSAPTHAWLENHSAAPLILPYRDVDGTPSRCETAPGINIVPDSVASANFLPGETAVLNGALELVEPPTSLRDREAVALVAKTKSRQALAAWTKLETRPAVLAAIAAQLGAVTR